MNETTPEQTVSKNSTVKHLIHLYRYLGLGTLFSLLTESALYGGILTIVFFIIAQLFAYRITRKYAYFFSFIGIIAVIASGLYGILIADNVTRNLLYFIPTFLGPAYLGILLILSLTISSPGSGGHLPLNPIVNAILILISSYLYLWIYLSNVYLSTGGA